MPPSFIPAILQRQHAAELLYPRAMQCYAIPYGWPGFAGDLAAFYIALRIHHGQPPLFFFHHREIRYPRLAKWLVTTQFLLCTALGIWNSIRCSSFNPRQDGLILISVARTFIAFFNWITLTTKPNPSCPGNCDNPSPNGTARGEYLDPDAAVAAAEVAQEGRVECEDVDANKATSIPLQTKAAEHPTGAPPESQPPASPHVAVPGSSQAPSDPPPPYSADPPETANDAAAEAPGTDDAHTKTKDLEPGAMVIMYIIHLIPLSLIPVGIYLTMAGVEAAGGQIAIDARNSSIFVNVILGMGGFLLALSLLIPVCEFTFGDRSGNLEELRKDAKNRVKFGIWGALFLAAVGMVFNSNWALHTAAGGDMPDGSRPDVFVLYWVYFVTSKLALFAF
ncbi:hypothetical protein QBC34DRAFT_212380 [Podospora aff. communis PSN243]|uniref:Uncharacterized protein n=1 Tax=Podospora aff. communis PSN243 TaxID=3040156 RepID=A0AAV9G4X4_9PEZI|nr:hypothetical protein QBC34DRAFT_212380 [Podospora aff. communis PSN243]